MKSFKAFILVLCIFTLTVHPAQAATLGPATSYNELLSFIEMAEDGDVLLISGELTAAGDPLSPAVSVSISSASEEMSAIRGLRLADATISLSHIALLDSLEITGTSYVELGRDVVVLGAAGSSALSFDGNGALLMDPSCQVTGGEQADAIFIAHRGGEFYAGIEGTIRGGNGYAGGTGVVISPLGDIGTLMISGQISGGDGEAIGGHALNLFDLSGNAYVTVTGTLTGGQGAIGGDGIQLVAATGNAIVGISGTITGGQGEDFGGDALILMNAEGASSVNLSGMLTGGDVTQPGAQPGVSLLVVGQNSSTHTRVGDCILQDGRQLGQSSETPSPTPEITPAPAITPLPEITSSVDASQTLPEPTPELEILPSEEPSVAPASTEVPEEETTPGEAEALGEMAESIESSD